MFQNLQGTQVLDSVLADILGRVVQRMREQHMPIILKKHILGVFMSAFGYNSVLTIQFMEQNGITTQLLQEITKIAPQLNHQYEKKFFIIGLSNLLLCQQLPPSIQPILTDAIQELVGMVDRLNSQAAKQAKEQAERKMRKEVQEDDDSDDDDTEDDDDDIDDFDSDADESG